MSLICRPGTLQRSALEQTKLAYSGTGISPTVTVGARRHFGTVAFLPISNLQHIRRTSPLVTRKSYPSKTECQNPNPGRITTLLDRPGTTCSLSMNSLPLSPFLYPLNQLKYLRLSPCDVWQTICGVERQKQTSEIALCTPGKAHRFFVTQVQLYCHLSLLGGAQWTK